ncbi:hypothetical protein BJ741DRAFT_648030 [Chytriomyces cf. hyalinus JEL632]|nr:hypothetical protein BJ741DRAFT_648030 [Chytriomyces cf. hyalinus JEL632]
MNFNEFMKMRADIEADYARALQKLVKPHPDDIAKKLVKAAARIFLQKQGAYLYRIRRGNYSTHPPNFHIENSNYPVPHTLITINKRVQLQHRPYNKPAQILLLRILKRIADGNAATGSGSSNGIKHCWSCTVVSPI